jgi:hydroxymethylbilane synthase
MRPRLRIATRASELALWQSRYVAGALEQAWPGLDTELVTLTTSGDRILDRPLAGVGGKGLFVKELETALLEQRADLAVHSMKDVPWDLPPGLLIAAVLAREDPADVLVSRGGGALETVAHGACIGTSSVRRRAQLLALRADLTVLDLRGNVPTRLARWRRGDYDAIVLAAAGLQRLALTDANCHTLSTAAMLPAVGQGAIGIECRADDAATRNLVTALDHATTARCVAAERALSARLGGSCTLPVAGLARFVEDELILEGLVASVDGREVVRQTARGSQARAIELGTELGEHLLAAGAARILARDGVINH